MKNSERFALDQWLTDYPGNLTYKEVIDLMVGDEEEWTHELISVWEVVENFTLRQVATFIEDTKKQFEDYTIGAIHA
jgi:hypothetical protein